MLCVNNYVYTGPKQYRKTSTFYSKSYLPCLLLISQNISDIGIKYDFITERAQTALPPGAIKTSFQQGHTDKHYSCNASRHHTQ